MSRQREGAVELPEYLDAVSVSASFAECAWIYRA
jgi:hypothetical protein